MDTAEEDAANQDPQSDGTPAEAQGSSVDGAGDGACAGDGGEVVAHQDGGLCGNVVNTVFHGVCGSGFVQFTDAPLLAQVAAVEDVAADQDSDADDQKYKTVHFCLLLSYSLTNGSYRLPFFGAKFCSRILRAPFPAGLEKKRLVDTSIAAT